MNLQRHGLKKYKDRKTKNMHTLIKRKLKQLYQYQKKYIPGKGYDRIDISKWQKCQLAKKKEQY